MVAHIIYNVKPRVYETTIALIKRDINKGNVQGLDSVKEELRQIYGQINKGGKNNHQESALPAWEG
jgi:hypothetical protein